MDEIKEFAEALLDQLSVELNEEKVVSELSHKITEDTSFNVEFDNLNDISYEIFDKMKKHLKDFTSIEIPNNINISYLNLIDFKKLKSKKVYATERAKNYVDELFEAVSKNNFDDIVTMIKNDIIKFFVYSTYAKSYISKISTTYGDYYDSMIYINEFIMKRYPKIILYKYGKPYDSKFPMVRSAYVGALKMTILEEMIHSIQTKLHEINEESIRCVNYINEELAKIILNLDENTVSTLSKYLKLEDIPNEFPIAKRANLFFNINPDNFIVNTLGPDVMTFTKIEIDEKIDNAIPQLHDIYKQWLKPIQMHHAAFSVMEGMAKFIVERILKADKNFQDYKKIFYEQHTNTSYNMKKNLGETFVEMCFEQFKAKSFKIIMKKIPTTRELKEPKIYINRIINEK